MLTLHHQDSLFPRTKVLWLVLSAVLLLGSVLFFNEGRTTAHLQHSVEHVEAVLHKSEAAMESDLLRFESEPVERLFEIYTAEQSQLEAMGRSYYVFDSGQLSAWSSNAVPNARQLLDLAGAGPCILLPNGWYLIKERQIDDRRLIALFLVKYEYLYQNKYLVNRFNECFRIDQGAEIASTIETGGLPVRDHAGTEIFYLTGTEAGYTSPLRGGLVLLCLLLFIYFFIKFLFERLYQRSDRLIWAVAGVVAILSLRLMMFLLGWPWSLIDISTFDPSVYAHSFLYPSLADLWVNAFILLMLSYAVKEWVKRVSWSPAPWIVLLTQLGFFILASELNKLVRSLIQDSNIQFNISNFFELDYHSLFGVIAVSMLLLAMLFAAQLLVNLIQRLRFSWPQILLAGAAVISAVIAFNHWKGEVDMIKVLWPVVLVVYLLLTERSRESGTRLVYVLGALAILSFYAAHKFEKNVVDKDRNKLEVVAERLMEGGDPVAEYLFEDMRESIAADSSLWSLLSGPEQTDERIVDVLRRDYFNGYWTKYDLYLEQVTEQNPLGQYALSPDSMRLGLYKVPRSDLGLNYVLKLAPDGFAKTYILQFKLGIIPEELGFPELLIEGNSSLGDELSRYSYAQYISGALVNRYGDYDYTLRQPFSPRDYKYYLEGDYWHFPFSRGDDAYIISTPRKSFMNRLTTFTYLFSFLGLFIAVAYVIEQLLFKGRWPRPDLQNKVQFLVVGVLCSALLVFGVGAYYYIISQNKDNNEGILSEKVSSVLIELSQKLEKEQAFGDHKKLELYLDKFSKVFFTDINLYALDGSLLASSRPLVFSRGLISEQMDPEAFARLSFEHQSRYIHQELIGELEYLSAYVPFVNSKREVIAYLNLPYFAKQTELEDELSRFLVAVVNILVLLFVLSILVAVLVSNWITRPLQLLKENLASMRLDRRNEPIPYDGSDEIASLVNEYNSKVNELQENAELLAKSERESAWREMAKQVAHEIKNPLTPMKLSIQYLQRSQADKGPDWEDRFKRSTNMLIEQIDTLSGIATAFSDFAKMPKAINEHFAIAGLVQQVTDLFSEEPLAQIELIIGVPQDAEVFTDKDQMTRLLTNLIKNAIQSVPEERAGEVTVSLIAKGYQYIIEVKDNGIGILEEMRERIFVPNFTTKSTGTGLGLAMCKNIVEQAGGQIWFTTEVGVGTSFYVSLPQP